MLTFMQVVSSLSERQCEVEKNSCKIPEVMGSTMEVGKYATCRYHWKKSLPFNVADKILLFVNYGQVDSGMTKVELLLKKSHYYSGELRIPCGEHSGILRVSQVDYQLESIQVKNYMFEIDLYIKDEPSNEFSSSPISRSINITRISPDISLQDQRIKSRLRLQKMSSTQNERAQTPDSTLTTEQELTLSINENKPSLSLDKQDGSEDNIGIFINDASSFDGRTTSKCIVSDVLEAKTPLQHTVWPNHSKETNANPDLFSKQISCNFESSNNLDLLSMNPETICENSGCVDKDPYLDMSPLLSTNILRPNDIEPSCSFYGSNPESLTRTQNDSLNLISALDWKDSLLSANQTTQNTMTNETHPICSDSKKIPVMTPQDATDTKCSMSSDLVPLVTPAVSPIPVGHNLLQHQQELQPLLPLPPQQQQQQHHPLQPQQHQQEQQQPQPIQPEQQEQQMLLQQQQQQQQHQQQQQQQLQQHLLQQQQQQLLHVQQGPVPCIPNGSDILPVFARKIYSSGNEVSGDTRDLTKPGRYAEDNIDLTHKLDLLQKMNETLHVELVQLRGSVPELVSKTHLSWLQSQSTLLKEECRDSLVKHLKEEKQSLQDEVMRLKEELFRYRHLVANSQNSSINSDAYSICSSFHGDNLVLHKQIADLQQQVIHLQETNLVTSGQLTKALREINSFQTQTYKITDLERVQDARGHLEQIDSKLENCTSSPVFTSTNEGDVYAWNGSQSNQDSNENTGCEETLKTNENNNKSLATGNIEVTDCVFPQTNSRHLSAESKEMQNIPGGKSQLENNHSGPDCKSASELWAKDKAQLTEMGTDNMNLISSSLTSSKSGKRNDKMHREDAVNRKKEAQHREFNNIELVNNSLITDVHSFPPSRQTRWDQYNQVRLNETSIRKLQKSLDAQDHMHQSFLEHYKPNSNFQASLSHTNDQQKSSRNRFKRGVTPARTNGQFVHSATSDSTSCLLAASIFPVVTTSGDSPADLGDDVPDFSDTATDVLLNTTPTERNTMSSFYSPPLALSLSPTVKEDVTNRFCHQLSLDSISSSCQSVSNTDASSQHRSSRKRSQSAEPRVKNSAVSDTLQVDSIVAENRTARLHSSHPTQLNYMNRLKKVQEKPANRKFITGSESSKRQWSLTQGKRPYVPQSPDDIHLGDIVKFSKYGGKISQGIVKFIGPLSGRSDTYIGIELHQDDGKHDGVFEGNRYFKCKPNKGVFVTYNKIVMAWVPC
ncbi:uncharacterized protein LOC115227315 isoform X2 [Octopus sinensis]|uniref:Uncharacterized protein LOC115227315 isoform X2 n=1 Tax=Octopus sinensis TaxID=2607531 RepID=A0A7E6EP56_9MOLL|nr:uncharacterized protein LOC115227315 isoform X2 [Octopus sinensis]